MSGKGLLASYEYLDSTVDAITALRRAVFQPKAYMPYPDHHIEPALGYDQSPVRGWTLVGGRTGAAFAGRPSAVCAKAGRPPAQIRTASAQADGIFTERGARLRSRWLPSRPPDAARSAERLSRGIAVPKPWNRRRRYGWEPSTR